MDHKKIKEISKIIILMLFVGLGLVLAYLRESVRISYVLYALIVFDVFSLPFLQLLETLHYAWFDKKHPRFRYFNSAKLFLDDLEQISALMLAFDRENDDADGQPRKLELIVGGRHYTSVEDLRNEELLELGNLAMVSPSRTMSVLVWSPAVTKLYCEDHSPQAKQAFSAIEKLLKDSERNRLFSFILRYGAAALLVFGLDQVLLVSQTAIHVPFWAKIVFWVLSSNLLVLHTVYLDLYQNPKIFTTSRKEYGEIGISEYSTVPIFWGYGIAIYSAILATGLFIGGRGFAAYVFVILGAVSFLIAKVFSRRDEQWGTSNRLKNRDADQKLVDKYRERRQSVFDKFIDDFSSQDNLGLLQKQLSGPFEDEMEAIRDAEEAEFFKLKKYSQFFNAIHGYAKRDLSHNQILKALKQDREYFDEIPMYQTAPVLIKLERVLLHGRFPRQDVVDEVFESPILTVSAEPCSYFVMGRKFAIRFDYSTTTRAHIVSILFDDRVVLEVSTNPTYRDLRNSDGCGLDHVYGLSFHSLLSFEPGPWIKHFFVFYLCQEEEAKLVWLSSR